MPRMFQDPVMTAKYELALNSHCTRMQNCTVVGNVSNYHAGFCGSLLFPAPSASQLNALIYPWAPFHLILLTKHVTTMQCLTKNILSHVITRVQVGLQIKFKGLIPSRSSMVFSSLATDLSANSARVSAWVEEQSLTLASAIKRFTLPTTDLKEAKCSHLN